jgi:hypothetical protein
MISKDQRNITTLKFTTGQLFTAAAQHLTRVVVKYKNLENKVIPRKYLSQQNYIRIADSD